MATGKFWIALLAGWLVMTNGCAGTLVDGKSVSDVFDDARVAAAVAAVSSGDFATAEQQLTAGADINAVGADGLTPLLWVMGTTLNVRRIEFLLNAGANPNYRDPRSQISPMYLAAGGNRPDILELLLRHKGDPNLTGKRGQTLLMVAVMQFRDKNIDLLMRYGADISRTDELGRTVANTSSSMGRFDQVVFFLERGLNYDVQRLARAVDVRQVPANSDAQRWKDKAIEMLKARGAKFPTAPLFDPPPK